MTSALIREIAERIASDPACADGVWHNRVKAVLPHLSQVEQLQDELQYWYECVPMEERAKSPFGIAVA
jgi:hypothetical protein